MPADIAVMFEDVSGLVQCFAGCCLLCAYGVKRWSDTQDVAGAFVALTEDCVLLDAYKSKRKKHIMS